MKVLVDVFDQNWGLRVSYPVLERGEAASAEDHARRGLRRAVQDGHVHKDEEKFCQIDPKLRSPLVVVVKYPLNRPRKADKGARTQVGLRRRRTDCGQISLNDYFGRRRGRFELGAFRELANDDVVCGAG